MLKTGEVFNASAGAIAYAINPLLDLDTDCILDVEATPARFSAEVAAGKAYGNGPLLEWLIDEGITPNVPVIDWTRQRDAFFTRDAFRYDRDAIVYYCPNDKVLTYRGTVRASQVRTYRSRPADCAACALKPQCTTA